MLTPTPLKTHGGKKHLAKKIVAQMPPRFSTENPDGYIHYVEPYFGGGSVLLANNPEGISEVVNDLNWSLSTFWRVLQHERMFSLFHRELSAVPFSESEFRAAVDNFDQSDPVASAVNFFIVARQSLAGRGDSFSGITKTRTRSGMNGETSAWISAVDGLPNVHARMRRVLVLNRPAINVIKGQDSPQTLFYADPPYVHETRETTGEYLHEMADSDHVELLETLASINGKFMLSGYPSELYDSFAEKHNWRHVDFQTPNHASGAKKKRIMTERLWMNYGENGERL